METKRLFIPAAKMADDGPGWLEGYGAVFGNVDRDNDVIVKGAFADALVPLVRDGFMPIGHNWGGMGIATIEEASEDDHGLWLKAQFHSTPTAQEVRTSVRERLERGKTVGLSIGYSVPEGGAEYKDGIRQINRADLYEVSIVTVPANPRAQATAAKGAHLDLDDLPLDDHGALLLGLIDHYTARTKGRAAMRGKEGRTLSEANRAFLAKLPPALRGHADEVEALLTATAPKSQDAAKAARALRNSALRRMSELHQLAS